jgi:hypothetical protein
VRFNSKVWFACTRQETTSSVWQKPARGSSFRADSATQQIEPLTHGNESTVLVRPGTVI